jgi:hypothetical protein
MKNSKGEDIVFGPGIIYKVGIVDIDGEVIGWGMYGGQKDYRYPDGYSVNDLIGIYRSHKAEKYRDYLAESIQVLTRG